MPETPLILKFKAGNPEAFKEIYHLFFEQVYNICFRYTRRHEVAEELTHDAFVLLWQKYDLIDPVLDVKAYLVTIARHEAFRWIKKNAQQESVKAKVQTQLIAQQESVRQDLSADSSLDLERIKNFLHSFPAKRRKVFEMVRFDEMSYNEVAEKLAISRDAVKDHMVKANRSIRKFNAESELSCELMLVAMFFLQ